VASLLPTLVRSARPEGRPGQRIAKPERVCRPCWFRHGPPVLLPALLLVALTPDVPLIERDGPRSVTSAAVNSLAARPRPAVTSVLEPAPAISGARPVRRHSTPSAATVGPKPAATLPWPAATSLTVRALTPVTKEDVASNAGPGLSRPVPTPVPGLGPAQSIREAHFSERDGTLYVGNVPPPRGRDRGPRQSAGPGQDRGISVDQRSPRREPWHPAAGRTNLPVSKT
jgi:hypothetical protein